MSAKHTGTLYLIPSSLGSRNDRQLSPMFRETVARIRHFAVEELKLARRFLKTVDPKIAIGALRFYPLHKKTPEAEWRSYIMVLEEGYDLGVLSGAGAPAVADPGSGLVRLAHQKGLGVVPLTGPSSFLLALMASGLNGQCFACWGYLPIQSKARIQRFKELEVLSRRNRQTQIFMETPYRNMALLQDILKVAKASTLLCVAANLDTPEAFIRTQSVAQWKSQLPELHKKPAVFLIEALP